MNYSDNSILPSEGSRLTSLHLPSKNLQPIVPGQDMAKSYLKKIIDQDEDWGNVSVRARVLTHLTTFIDISERYHTLPILNSLAKDTLASVKKRWEGAKPLDLYPAFRR